MVSIRKSQMDDSNVQAIISLNDQQVCFSKLRPTNKVMAT
jgi:hypothetical protein